VERHLIIQEVSLWPSGEWKPDEASWTVVRVAEGFGYCLQNGEAREMNQGDLFITGPHAGTVFRASQLGIAKLEFYLVQPQYLNGLLTVTEWSQLEAVANLVPPRAQYFLANELPAQKFVRLVAQSPRDSLSVRTALLQLWAAAINGLLPALVSAVNGNKLRERFRQAIGQMSEADLAGKTLTELAALLHCSERHFSRLFREEFGVALRTRQTELRLQRARQLLADSNAKIINVAYESGYRHLGLFNAMFKKRFGVTPSEWRQRNCPAPTKLNLPRRAAVMVAWLFLWLQLASAGFAQATNASASKAGSSTNVVQTFTVEKYQVQGNTILSPQRLGEIFTNVPAAFGTNVTLDDIRAQLGNLQSAYRERGYVTVSVGLPPQKLTNATVKVKVTEGRLSTITVKGNKHFSTENVLRALPSLHTNMLLNSHVFQSELDAANANRDRQIYPVIGPGLDPGTTELTLKVKDRFPLHARVEFNNQATPGTPANRVAFNAEYDNLWGLEHQVGVQYTFSPFDYSTANTFEVTPLDRPMVANYSAYYRMPLGDPSSVQQQIDNGGVKAGYNEVTHQFVLPPSSGRPDVTMYASRSVNDSGVTFDNGIIILDPNSTTNQIGLGERPSGETVTLNQGVGFKFSLPLPTMGRMASTLSFGGDYKYYQIRNLSALNFYQLSIVTNGGSTAIEYGQFVGSYQIPVIHTVQYFPLNVGINGSVPDPLGTTFFNAQANLNVATIGNMSEVAYTTNTHNNYFTLQMGASREQRIYKDWTVLLRADGQWASMPLFSNEQYGMGGTAGVRGYYDGTAYGDSGWRVSVEPRTPLMKLGEVDGNVPMYVRASVFMDYGQVFVSDGYYAKSPYLGSPFFSPISGNPSHLEFWGAGWSLTANIGSHLDGRLTMGFPLLNPGGESDWSPLHDLHVYFGIGAQF
jgi:hemolysin activation/secretion protein/AraC-like DNA-binding protein